VADGQTWPLAVAAVMMAETVPIVFLSPIGGVFADRWDRRRTMLVADAVRFCMIGALALVAFEGPALSPGVLLGITCTVGALTATASQFFNPARFGLLGAVVADVDRERVASITTGTAALAGIIGPSLGAVLLVTTGAQWAIGLSAASYAVSFFAVAMVRKKRVSATPEQVGEQGSVWHELITGARYFAGNRLLKVLLFTTVAVTMGVSWLGTLEVFFVTQNLHGGPELFGILATVSSVGTLAGAALTAAFAKRLRATSVYAYSLVASGVVLICYARMTSPLGAVIIMFLAGFPLAAMNSMIGPLMLRSAPAHLLGRISTVFQPATHLTSLASVWLGAWFASTVLRDMDVTVSGLHFGPIDTIILAAGVVIATAGLGAARAFRTPHAAGPQTPQPAGPQDAAQPADRDEGSEVGQGGV
jgi:MFS family permease